MGSKFQEFIGKCWTDHDGKSEEVALRLETNLSLLETPENIAPYV